MTEGKEPLRSVTIDHVTIHLHQPDVVACEWIGQKEVHRLLSAAWLKVDEKDPPMTPVLRGSPGGGKTTLGCAVADAFGQPVYIINCTSDMRPEDLLVTPVLSSEQQIIYQASSLVSAMINGGVCILDEGNRMNEKSWGSLASLLDDRRYIESITAGVKIPAHEDFKLVTTMNDDASTFNLPEYIESRLKPVIPVPFPRLDELKEIVSHHAPHISPSLIQAVVEFLYDNKQKGGLHEYSIRDAIQITRYARKLEAAGIHESVEYAARKIVQIREQTKSSFSIQFT
jgi:MoxR-like ATPase